MYEHNMGHHENVLCVSNSLYNTRIMSISKGHQRLQSEDINGRHWPFTVTCNVNVYHLNVTTSSEVKLVTKKGPTILIFTPCSWDIEKSYDIIHRNGKLN